MKAVKTSVVPQGNELSRFSDPPGDASLDDLFHPLEKNLENRAAEVSLSASSSQIAQNNAIAETGKNDLATKLRATIAKKQMESESGPPNGGDLLSIMMGVLKEDVIDMDGLVCVLIHFCLIYVYFVTPHRLSPLFSYFFLFWMLFQGFDDKLPTENLFHLQVLLD